jgi:ankyrin repeat protein
MASAHELFAAIKEGNAPQTSAMLAANPELAADRPADGPSPLLLAIYYGRPAVVDAVLSSGVALTIFEAAALGRYERAAALLAEQPELANAVAPDGFTPLGLAAFLGQPKLVDLLLSYGAEVNAASRNAQRVMPLHSAVASQRLAIATTLIEHGADVNAQQADAFTPLHGAAQNGQIAMVQLLLDHGADRHARAANGQTALDLARAGQHADVAALLEQTSQPA